MVARNDSTEHQRHRGRPRIRAHQNDTFMEQTFVILRLPTKLIGGVEGGSPEQVRSTEDTRLYQLGG